MPDHNGSQQDSQRFAADHATAREWRNVTKSAFPAPFTVPEAQLKAGFDEARTDTARI